MTSTCTSAPREVEMAHEVTQVSVTPRMPVKVVVVQVLLLKCFVRILRRVSRYGTSTSYYEVIRTRKQSYFSFEEEPLFLRISISFSIEGFPFIQFISLLKTFFENRLMQRRMFLSGLMRLAS